MARIRLLLGVNIFWLALSVLFDGLNSIVLPAYLLTASGEQAAATRLGVITFAGLLLGMLVQPVAGLFSDHVHPRWGRRGVLTLGVTFTLAGLALFGAADYLLLALAGYLVIQVAASVAQAAEQAFIPDLVDAEARGTASGVKGFMDLLGALLGFAALGQLLQSGGVTLALAAITAIILATFFLTLLLVREPVQAEAKAPARLTLRRAFQTDWQEHRAFVWLVVSRWLFLLGTYAVGRFLLLFVADRLGLEAGDAAEAAGMLLAALTLVAILATIPAGWLADRLGRMPLMVAGSFLSAAGAFLLIWAGNATQILLFGTLMGLGSAAFAGANWALTADLVPDTEAARFFALANFGTAGAAAAAGLFGPLVDWTNDIAAGTGFPLLFGAAAVAFLLSLAPLRVVSTALQEFHPGAGPVGIYDEQSDSHQGSARPT